MELINQTAAPAKVWISQLRDDLRVGHVALKATFEVVPNGVVRLVDEDPLPIFDDEVSTSLGRLPSDVVVRASSGLDIVVAAAAYSSGAPVKSMTVTLRVGDQTWHMLVTGDRHWQGAGEHATITEPIPFRRMPLTWDRSFGGGADVWVDPHTRVPVSHPGNPSGRGFDLATAATRLGAAWGAPEGFPRFEGVRALPNLERPDEPITRWEDAPNPYGWAAVPVELAPFLLAQQRELGSPAKARPQRVAHPDLQLPIPGVGDPIVLEGAHPSGSWWFRWPQLRPVADYNLAGRTGTLGLEPVNLVLLPEEDRITVTFRARFRMGYYEEDSERSLRIRLES